MERKRTGIETLMNYKNREKRWIEREKRWTEEKGKGTDLETWKEAVTAYLLELARCTVPNTAMNIFRKIRKIGYLKSWEEAFSFYDSKILEEVILEDAVLLYMPELEKDDVESFESLMEKKSPEEIFVAFIEQEMDRRPGLLPGNVILDVLDKLFLLRHEETIRDP